MSYTLVGTVRSPFVRVCRMLMIQNQIPFEFRVLNFVDDPVAAQELARITPINRVPLLYDGDEKIFDSRVIVNYLTRRHGLRPLSLAEENLVSSIYSCIDSSVVLFLMRNEGYDVESSGHFVSRHRARIPSNLEYLRPWVKTLDSENPDHWNYVSMSLYSFLYWGERRAKTIKVDEHPEFAEFMKRFAKHPGVEETSF